MAPFKTKGDLAELKVATDLADRGCRISIPLSEACDYDLIANYKGRLPESRHSGSKCLHEPRPQS